MSRHGLGERCPVGSRTPEYAHELGTNPHCGLCNDTPRARVAQALAAWGEAIKERIA